MAEVPVRVLGGVRLEGLGGEVRVGGLLAERLLGALVAASGAAVPTDALADVLWPTDPPEDPDPPLRMAVSRLRQRLADVGIPDAVRATRRAYRLYVEPHLIDVSRFTVMIDDARRLAPTEPDRAAAHLDGALALWRGEPFGSLSSESWAMGPVAHLVERRLAAEEELAALDLVRHREAIVVDRLRLAVGSQPLRERRWVQLATALYRLGRQADALRAVDAARTVLREQLGIDPGEGLRDIERALLDQDPTLLADDTPLMNSLPSPERLVGRDGDVKELARLLDANRLVTVHGFGGVGKSAIARAVAGRSSGARPNVLVAHLDGVTDPEAVWLAVAAAAGLAGADDPRDLPAAIAGRLSTRPTLLVLDGAEAGVETAAEVAESLLLLVASVKLLVTSRVPLGATGEVRYALDGLHVDADDGDAPAVDLFLDRAGISPAQLDESARAAIVRVCELAGGLPLAIELAAATTDLHGLPALATGEPAHGAADVLRDMVRWSLEVLPSSSKPLLARLSLLPDGASPDAAACLGEVPVDEVRRLLAPLVQARLLGAVGNGPTGLRYRVAHVVGELSAELLDSDGAARSAALVIGHLLSVAATVGDLDRRPCHPAVPHVEAEVGNIRYWLGRSMGSESGLELAVAVAPTLCELGLGAESARWLRRHRDGCPDAEPILRARATVAAAGSQEAPLAIADLEAGLAAAESCEAWRMWLYLAGRMAIGRMWSGDLAGVGELLYDHRVVERLANLADPWMDLQREQIIAVLPAASGQFAAARAGLDQIPGRFLELEAPSSALLAMFVRARLARSAGNVDGAAKDLAAARELAATGAARGIQALVGAELAHLARARGDAGALPMLVVAIDDLERAGNERSAAFERRDLGSWRLDDGDTSGGLAEMRAALPMLLRVDRRGAALSLAEIASGVAETRPTDCAGIAGAALHLLTTSSGAAPEPAQKARVEEVARIAAIGHEQAFAEGGYLDDEALIELSLAN